MSAGGGGQRRPPAVLYAAAVALAFVSPWIAAVIYVGNAMVWFIPDRRIESRMKA